MPRILTIDDYRQVLSVSGWKLLDIQKIPDIRYTSKKHKKVRVACRTCNFPSWVLYQNIKKGISKCCKKCSRLPTKEKLDGLVKKYDMLWIPTCLHKTYKGRRIFWMTCSGCKKGYWVAWSRFSQGNTTGCRSCSKSRHHGSLQDRSKHYKHPLKAAWRLMGAHTISRKNQRQWDSFEDFKRWAHSAGYCESAKPVIKKKNNQLPFSPSNCIWSATAENGRNTVKESYK